MNFDEVDRRRAIGAGLGMLVVVLCYGASGLGDPDRWWASGAVLIVAILLADGLDDLRSLLPTPGAAPLALIGTLFAIALCVPETDQLPIVALLPGALLLLEVIGRRQYPTEWYVVAAAAIAWGGLFGATGRQSALAGAVFAWWAVLMPAMLHAARPVAVPWRAITIAGLGSIAAVVFARTGGITDRNAEIVIALVICSVVSFVASAALAGLGDSDGPPDPDVGLPPPVDS